MDYARPYTATLVHKIHTLRPRVVCILGRTIADTVSMVLHQSTAEADPEYTVSEPTPPESGVLAFKIVHDMEAGRADATYLFKVSPVVVAIRSTILTRPGPLDLLFTGQEPRQTGERFRESPSQPCRDEPLSDQVAT